MIKLTEFLWQENKILLYSSQTISLLQMSLFKVKQWLTEIIFQFSAAQTKALTIILIAIFSLYYLNHNAPNIFYKEQKADSNFISRYQDFIKQLEPKKQKPYLNRLDSYILRRYDTIKLFPFNPNTASRQTLLKLGLTEKQVNTLINYRNHGGRFYTKDDFRRLYGLRYMQYKILRHYLLLPDSTTRSTYKPHTPKVKSHRATQLFAFDPNTISHDSLVLLGFSPRQAQAIIKVRQKGWHFRTKKDFAKLYVVNDEMYSHLEPYILLPDSIIYKKKASSATKTRIELNTTDASTLQKALDLKPWIAKRVIKYRKTLGGFYSKQQIKEVYGFPREKYPQIRKQIYVDTNRITKINIQTASFGELVRHPYIDKDLADWIIHQRKKGKLRSAQDMMHYKAMGKYEMKILLHYIRFE